MNSIHIPFFLQQAVFATLRKALDRANHRLNKQYPEPKINWRQRGTIAGSAWYQNWEIRLNPHLLIENQQDFIQQVIPHELAHLLVWRQFGKVPPHGKEWQWMMNSVLDEIPHRTHRFATSSVIGSTYPYYCHCRLHQLTVRRHNKVLRGQSEYRCRQCGHPLIYGELANI